MSTSYYDEHAERFFADTVEADMSAARARFLKYVPAGGSILDAGCGSGRDSLAFSRQGFEVEAFDGSAEMVRLARAHTKLPVRQLTFDQVTWEQQFDGVWACASLLHLSRQALPDGLERLARALKAEGVLFASFKYGNGERHVQGRRFTDLDEEGLRTFLTRASLEPLEIWNTADVRPGRHAEQWISGIARKPGAANVSASQLWS